MQARLAAFHESGWAVGSICRIDYRCSMGYFPHQRDQRVKELDCLASGTFHSDLLPQRDAAEHDRSRIARAHFDNAFRRVHLQGDVRSCG